jgi:hypothetical protein
LYAAVAKVNIHATRATPRERVCRRKPVIEVNSKGV